MSDDPSQATASQLLLTLANDNPDAAEIACSILQSLADAPPEAQQAVIRVILNAARPVLEEDGEHKRRRALGSLLKMIESHRAERAEHKRQLRVHQTALLGVVEKYRGDLDDYKARRNAKPRNADRDTKIVELRDSNPRIWTWGKLARKFDMTETAAQKAYKRAKRTNG